mgnify:CR=1 FL=1
MALLSDPERSFVVEYDAPAEAHTLPAALLPDTGWQHQQKNGWTCALFFPDGAGPSTRVVYIWQIINLIGSTSQLGVLQLQYTLLGAVCAITNNSRTRAITKC